MNLPDSSVSASRRDLTLSSLSLRHCFRIWRQVCGRRLLCSLTRQQCASSSAVDTGHRIAPDEKAPMTSSALRRPAGFEVSVGHHRMSVATRFSATALFKAEHA